MCLKYLNKNLSYGLKLNKAKGTTQEYVIIWDPYRREDSSFKIDRSLRNNKADVSDKRRKMVRSPGQFTLKYRVITKAAVAAEFSFSLTPTQLIIIVYNRTQI